MKVIIAGGRYYSADLKDIRDIADLLLQYKVTEIVSGGAQGADYFGEQMAKIAKIKLKVFPAKWDIYGKSAGYKRNVQMAEYADAVILFPGGKGTDHMYDIAKLKGLKIMDWRTNESFHSASC